jgi:hypothetical protein
MMIQVDSLLGHRFAHTILNSDLFERVHIDSIVKTPAQTSPTITLRVVNVS